jgi:hypothetical protein
MKKMIRLFVLLSVLLSTTFAHAISDPEKGTWTTTLEGRYLGRVTPSGYQAYYDTVLDITWLVTTFARYDGSGFDGSADFTPPPLQMTWDDAVSWAADVNVVGYDDWRLPRTTDLDIGWCADPWQGCGYNIRSQNSELSHFFYETLGNVGKFDEAGNVRFDNGWPTNYGPFYDLYGASYWFETPSEFTHPQAGPLVWFFDMGFGFQGVAPKSDLKHYMAVMDGDIATPVPEPSSSMMMFLGLISLISLTRIKS